jgi:hypothetical protein
LHTLCPAATTSPHHGKKPKGLKCSTSRFFHTYPSKPPKRLRCAL